MKNYILVAVLSLSTITGWAAERYPNRPIRIVVNAVAGALLDVTTRAIAQQMAIELGQPIVVENRAGAAGLMGIRHVKGSPPDGYTLLSVANTFAQLPAFSPSPGYRLEDFTGIGIMNEAPLLMVGPPSQTAKSLAELIAQAKANPGQLTMASAGVGTSTHMAGALFVQQAKVPVLHVPYKGNALALPDVIGGRINFLFDGGSSSRPNIESGKLRAFGVTSANRSPAFRDIPTLAEQGVPDYDFVVYQGLVAPAGIPSNVVERLAKALRVAQTSDAVTQRFKEDGAEPGSLSPEQFTEFLKQDLARTVKVVDELQISKQ